MRRNIFSVIIIAACCIFSTASAQTSNPVPDSRRTMALINEYGTFDRWCVREVKESGIIGGKTKYLYEFYGDGDTTISRTALVKPDFYLWRTNNVLANVAGIIKTNNTVFPEKRGEGYCARIETHIEEVVAMGINMQVVCQGDLLVGDLVEPIRNTKDPMAKVLYGLPFDARPSAMVFDYKADVGHTVVRGTGFSKLKTLDGVDYPEVCIMLQKRWEDSDGNVHALRVGTGMERIEKNASSWVNGHRIEVKYGDISALPGYRDYMGLRDNNENGFHTINSRGHNVLVHEEGWADPDETPNWMIIYFLASCGKAFYGGVGNTLWIDNVRVE